MKKMEAEMYKKRYSNTTMQAIYENSCDCIRYGYGFSYLNTCGMEEVDARIIWDIAYRDMANGF